MAEWSGWKPTCLPKWAMSASPIPEAKPLLRVKARVRTFLRNHAPDIAAMDPFVVPTIGFDLLYAYIMVRLDRRELVWISVTTHPTAEWVARQITEEFPWDEAPHYLIRDRDRRCRTDRSGASVWVTSSFWARRICVGF